MDGHLGCFQFGYFMETGTHFSCVYTCRSGITALPHFQHICFSLFKSVASVEVGCPTCAGASFVPECGGLCMVDLWV